jgi:hypothetical protein
MEDPFHLRWGFHVTMSSDPASLNKVHRAAVSPLRAGIHGRPLITRDVYIIYKNIIDIFSGSVMFDPSDHVSHGRPRAPEKEKTT